MAGRGHDWLRDKNYPIGRRPDGELWGIARSSEDSDELDDDRKIGVKSLGRFLRYQRLVTRGTANETPLLGQIVLDRPVVRRLAGPVIAAYAFYTADLIDGVVPPMGHGEAIAKGHAVFALTDDADRGLRTGREGIVDEVKRAVISAETAGITSTPLQVGRTVLGLLEGTAAHGSAQDALLALNLYALAEQAAVAEDPQAAA